MNVNDSQFSFCCDRFSILNRIIVLIVFIVHLPFSMSYGYQWFEGEPIPTTGVSNPYNYDQNELLRTKRAGLLHALHWPVDVTGTLLPLTPLQNQLPVILNILKLNDYPETEGEGPYFVPFKNGVKPDHPMGFSIIEKLGVQGVTFACASCHSANLFGRRVMGLTNRFPGANDLIDKGVRWSKPVPPALFQNLFGASTADTKMYKTTRRNLYSVEAKKPIQLGLDTSLAHVALSLSRRNPDAWATRNGYYEEYPREEKLRQQVADSKPAVWWNVKYKNRWLSDGSVLSGNPILTNILWNEIGRGTDLTELNRWFNSNQGTIKELTSAIYQSEPPHITDFVSAEKINLDHAKSGEKIFLRKCAGCHGTYKKGWSFVGSENWPLAEKLKTVEVQYFNQTPIKNVGTDPLRYLGMSSLEQLNRLDVSKNYGIKIKSQKGYVPPPLVGIWARYPYFHNNSVPNLCELLSSEKERVDRYYAGEAREIDTDFDFDCNGYPIREKTPVHWRKAEYLYNSSRKGLSNLGHDFGFDEFTHINRRDLIRFLQTL